MQTKKNILILWCLILSLITTIQSYAQMSADPNHEIYTHINKWVGRGYVKELPSFRPLPEQVLKHILEIVVKVGSFRDRVIASTYLERVNTTTVENYSYGMFSVVPNDNSNEEYGLIAKTGSLFVTSSFLTPIVGLSASLGINGKLTTKHAQDDTYLYTKPFINSYVSILDDSPDDSIRFKNVLGGSTVEAAWVSRTSFTVGTKDLFVQTGVMQRSLGFSTDDGIIVSPLAKYSPNIIVHWNLQKVSFTWALFALSGRQSFKKFTVNKRGIIDYQFSTSDRMDKFFLYNVFTWFINPNFEFQAFESVMFGNFNFSYLLPFKYMYATDSLEDFAGGNLMIGFGLKVRLNNNIIIPSTIVIDDFDPIALVKGDLNSTKKIAFETGVEWYPTNLFLKNISFKYQIIGSYTYSHGAVGDTYDSYSTGYNFSNHTHYGRSLASTMPPSSHRITLSTTITPVSFLELIFFIRGMQHNNPSAGILNGPLNDGSILDDGHYSVFDDPSKSGNSYKNRGTLDFLNGTIEHTLHFGSVINILDIPLTKSIALYSNIHYELQYTINKNLIDNKNKLSNEISGFLGLRVRLY